MTAANRVVRNADRGATAPRIVFIFSFRYGTGEVLARGSYSSSDCYSIAKSLRSCSEASIISPAISVPRIGTEPQAMQRNLVRCICASMSSREDAQNSFFLLLACLHVLQTKWYRYTKGAFQLLTQNSSVSRYHRAMKSNRNRLLSTQLLRIF